MTSTTLRNTDYSLLAFDPGLSNTGWVSCQWHDSVLTVLAGGVFHPNQTVHHKEFREECSRYASRLLTLDFLRQTITELQQRYQPDYWVAENAFYNRFRPSAYSALLQWLTIASWCLREQAQQPLYRIPPKLVKRIAARDGTSSKLSVQEAVLTHPQINLVADPTTFVEHTYDAIAIAYTFTQLTELPVQE